MVAVPPPSLPKGEADRPLIHRRDHVVDSPPGQDNVTHGGQVGREVRGDRKLATDREVPADVVRQPNASAVAGIASGGAVLGEVPGRQADGGFEEETTPTGAP